MTLAGGLHQKRAAGGVRFDGFELYRCSCHLLSQIVTAFDIFHTSGEVHLHHQNLPDVGHCMPPDSQLAAQNFPQTFHEQHEIY